MNIEIFNFEDKQMRMFILDGEIWAVGKDVANLFGYERARDAISQHCKNTRSAKDLFKSCEVPPFQLHPQTLLINEADINRLVFGSKLPRAEIIRDWWFEEVLPTIRKTGSYTVNSKLTQDTAQPQVSKAQKFLEDSKVFQEALKLTKQFFKDDQAKVSANNITQKITGTNIIKLVGATHLMPVPANEAELLTVTEVGRRLNLSARRTNSLLELAGFQTSYRDAKNRLCWKLTEKSKPHATYITSKKQNNDCSTSQIKWFASIVNQLKLIW